MDNVTAKFALDAAIARAQRAASYLRSEDDMRSSALVCIEDAMSLLGESLVSLKENSK